MFDKDQVMNEASAKQLMGLRVRRGPDWKWNDQDCHGCGVVISYFRTNPGGVAEVEVKWDLSSSYYYRMGGGIQDLEIIPDNELRDGRVMRVTTGWKNSPLFNTFRTHSWYKELVSVPELTLSSVEDNPDYAEFVCLRFEGGIPHNGVTVRRSNLTFWDSKESDPPLFEMYPWSAVQEKSAPTGNNDGRTNCRWCGGSVKEVPMLFSTIGVCRDCGR